jgi:hypothetical protein
MLLWLAQHFAQIGVAVAVVGVFLSYWALRANHDWNRRQFAATMAAEWNLRTASHRQAIERTMPGLVDVDLTGKLVELTKERAYVIYTSKADSDDWLLRFHFIELLNYFEFVATVYEHMVADRRMIEEGFKTPLLTWYDVLKNFISVFEARRGEQPGEAWAPYQRVVSEWNSSGLPRRQAPEALPFRWRKLWKSSKK